VCVCGGGVVNCGHRMARRDFYFIPPTLVVSLTSERNRNSRASSRPRPSGGFRESVRFVTKRGGFTHTLRLGEEVKTMDGWMDVEVKPNVWRGCWVGWVQCCYYQCSSLPLFFSFRAHHELGAVHLSAEILVMATKAASFFFWGED
jgi:hypothetical protein